MIQMDEKHLKIVQDILSKYPYTFYAFGSRVKGKPRRLSDLDLCFMEDIPWSHRAQIDEAFEESDLPYKVDVVDWNLCDEDFKREIKRDMILFYEP